MPLLPFTEDVDTLRHRLPNQLVCIKAKERLGNTCKHHHQGQCRICHQLGWTRHLIGGVQQILFSVAAQA